MERILHTVFPCCFPTRRRRSSAGEASERTPLLPDAVQPGSSRVSLNGGSGIATPGSGAGGRVKRQSVLPAPAYDAHVLRGIVDEFAGRIISVDPAAGGGTGGATGERGGVILTAAGVRTGTAEGREGTPEGRHVTPVHTLSIGPTKAERATRLVDIWSDPTPLSPPPGAATGTIGGMSYSAAAKRAPAIAPGGKKAKRAAKTAPTPTATGAKGVEEGVEQRTYEVLAEMVRAKPVVFDWAEEGDGDAL